MGQGFYTKQSKIPRPRGSLTASTRSKPENGDRLPAHLCHHVDSARSGASSGHRAQGCCGGDVDAGDRDDGLPRGFLVRDFQHVGGRSPCHFWTGWYVTWAVVRSKEFYSA